MMLGLFYLDRFSYYDPFLQYDVSTKNKEVVGPVYRNAISTLKPIIERYFPQNHFPHRDMQLINCHTTFLSMDIL